MGGNAARYAMEKENATVVKLNHMPEYLDANEIWYRMKHHCQLHQQDRTVGARKLERFMTTFVSIQGRVREVHWMTGRTSLMKRWMFLIQSDFYPRGSRRRSRPISAIQ